MILSILIVTCDRSELHIMICLSLKIVFIFANSVCSAEMFISSGSSPVAKLPVFMVDFIDFHFRHPVNPVISILTGDKKDNPMT